VSQASDHGTHSGFCETYQAAVELVGKRWNGAILAILLTGPKRYRQLALTVPGVSERLLSERLKELETAGLLVRRILPGPPIGVEYELTEPGRDLCEAIEAVSAWAHRWVATGQLRL